MAIQSVTAVVGGQAVTLSYDSQSGTWVGQYTPTGTSWHEPGHAFDATLTAVNSTGAAVSTDGGSFPGLRLVVNETDPPAITLVGPQPGIVNTNRPAITFLLQDPPGGAGIDPGTLSVSVDGKAVAATATPAGGGAYLAAYTPAQPLPEGPHLVGVTIADFDRNVAQYSVGYTVDTVPPRLSLESPRFRSVVDTPSVLFAGRAFDNTTPPVAVTLSINGQGYGTTLVDVQRGGFAWDVPLDVGANTVRVTAVDRAGWEAAEEFFIIRLVTDRAQADLDTLRALEARPVPTWTAEEKARFLAARYKGSYDHTDLNRATLAAAHLAEKFAGYGFSPGFVPVEIEPGRTDWQQGDMPLPALTQGFLQNVARLGQLLPMDTAPPDGLEGLTLEGANRIEKTLVLLDEYAPFLNNAFYAGEVYSGEV